MRRLAGLLALVLIAGSTPAAELIVQVKDARGKPIADAVATATPAGGAVAAPHTAAPATRVIDQRGETFIPYLEIFHVGDRVVFRNSDAVRHHVYSFSPVRSFEFMLVPGESSPPLTLDHAGVVAVGCNIHDHMITYLDIVDAPYVGRTDDAGTARLADVPPGQSYDVRVWHPQLRPGAEARLSVVLAADGSGSPVDVTLSLLPDPRRVIDRERTGY